MHDATGTTVSGSPAARFGTGVLVLLALSVLINYVDRGNLATVSPVMKAELGLTNTEYGTLVSAFFWSYVPGQLLAAWLVERLDAYRALALGLAVWSLATILSGLAGGFAVLLGLRLVLGLGESVSFPASSKLLAVHVPPNRLGGANALVLTGLYLGPAIGTFFGGLLLATLGWRLLFVLFGGLSLLWLVPWHLRTRSLALASQATVRATEPPYRELLSKRQLWGACLGHFASNYVLYFLLAWLPLFLVKTHGYSLVEMARLTGAVYALNAMFCWLAGRLADRLIARGASLTRVRLGMLVFAGLLGTVCMVVCSLGDARLAVGALLVSSIGFGCGGFNLFVVGQSLAGARAASRWVAIQNAFGNVAGVVSPVVTGLIIDWTGSYRYAFLLAATIVMVGVASWLFLVRRIEPITWTPAA